MRTITLLTIILCTSCPNIVFSTEDSGNAEDGYIEFPATKYPFAPKLLTSDNDAICKPFESAVQEDFVAPHIRKDYAGFGWGALMPGTFDIKGGTWIEDKQQVIALPAQSSQGSQSLLLRNEGYIHMSFLSSLYVKAGTVRADQEEKLLDWTIWDENKLKEDGWKPIFSERTYGNIPFHLLSMNGETYLYRDGSDRTDYYTKTDSVIPANNIGLYHIKPDGTLVPACTVQAAPMTTIAEPPYFRDRDKTLPNRPELAAPDAVLSYFKLTDQVEGESVHNQPCEGTNGPYAWAGYEIRRGLMRYNAVVRPWELKTKTAQNQFAFFNKWGISSLYNFRIYQQIIQALPHASAALADFYHEQYGMNPNNAAIAAKAALQQVLDATFVGYASYYRDPQYAELVKMGDNTDAFRKLYREEIASGSVNLRLIRRALLTGMTDLIQDTSKEQMENSSLSGQRPFHHHMRKHANPSEPIKDDYVMPLSEPPYIVAEPLIFYALDHPNMITLLLDKGLDANSQNWFGKTPLMYAAQWNLLDAITILLAHHADLNAATTPANGDGLDCSGTPKISGRTALMYAAENASASVIETLIKAGADTKTVDSKGRDIKDYLSRNIMLGDAERRRITALLSSASPPTIM